MSLHTSKGITSKIIKICQFFPPRDNIISPVIFFLPVGVNCFIYIVDAFNALLFILNKKNLHRSRWQSTDLKIYTYHIFVSLYFDSRLGKYYHIQKQKILTFFFKQILSFPNGKNVYQHLQFRTFFIRYENKAIRLEKN